jgi:hypothetical protein
MNEIFPWIDEEEAKYKARLERYGNIAKDESLVYFLNVLRLFRRILLQDVAAIAQKQSDFPLLHYHPFNTPAFRAYASTATSIIETAEAKARETQKNLPEQLTQAISVHLSAVHMQQQLQTMQLNELQKSMASFAGSSKKRKAASAFPDGKELISWITSMPTIRSSCFLQELLNSRHDLLHLVRLRAWHWRYRQRQIQLLKSSIQVQLATLLLLPSSPFLPSFKHPQTSSVVKETSTRHRPSHSARTLSLERYKSNQSQNLKNHSRQRNCAIIRSIGWSSATRPLAGFLSSSGGSQTAKGAHHHYLMYGRSMQLVLGSVSQLLN